MQPILWLKKKQNKHTEESSAVFRQQSPEFAAGDFPQQTAREVTSDLGLLGAGRRSAVSRKCLEAAFSPSVCSPDHYSTLLTTTLYQPMVWMNYYAKKSKELPEKLKLYSL
ncbi:hypothetical protein JOB18_026552 [Solea senegalensis]|uniref:Uncharacterized protein n=1 Tax=Solea senegalensis TaxID=28829 RepID=A0AAV6Q8N2_SOLSE|nr:hypothetical protein JOB18_026552 [Solea senegalensis]